MGSDHHSASKGHPSAGRPDGRVVMEISRGAALVQDQPPDAIGSPGLELVWSKLAAPAPRAGLLPRASLQSLLEVGLRAKLCLRGRSGRLRQDDPARPVAGGSRRAPGGLGLVGRGRRRPHTLLGLCGRGAAHRRAGRGGKCARRPGPPERGPVPDGPAGTAQRAEQRSELPLFLVLDDYHLITNPTCHQTLTFFLDHLPADVHVVLSTRSDPPLPLARMRARGELAEIRVADLQFTDEEALALLNGPMGLQLGTDDVAASGRADRGLGGRAGPGRSVASRPAGPQRLHRLVPWRQPPCRRLPERGGAGPPTGHHQEVPAGHLGPGAPVRPVVRRRAGGRRVGRAAGASWNAPICSWCRWMIGVSGIAIITCSRSCSAWSSTAGSLGCW